MTEREDDIKNLESVFKHTSDTIHPTPVTISGTTFGNKLQNQILNNITITNFLMFYLCTLATLRWIFNSN